MKMAWAWFGRRGGLARRLFLTAGVATGTAALLWFVPTPYFITAPGAAIDTSRLVQVGSGEPHRGRLLMLVVTTQPANLFWYLYAHADSRSVLETRQEFLGTVPDYPKYVELTRRMMSDSQKTAGAVALQELGYGRGVRPDGVAVVELLEQSSARGYLEPDDILLQVGDQAVRTAQELTDALKGIPAGTPVRVKLRRSGQELEQVVPTGEHPDPDRKGTAAFGIRVRDEFSYDLPIEVHIGAGPITGPSAGMMFTLQIIDQLTPGGITGGRTIAGTGTIEWDGSVGRIGGVKQKVFTAESTGAQVMFVPRGNYDAARSVATRIEVVPVDRVHDGLQWLKEHPGAGQGS